MSFFYNENMLNAYIMNERLQDDIYDLERGIYLKTEM